MAKAKDVYELDELTAYYNDIYKVIDSTSSKDPYGTYVLKRVKGGQKTVFNKSLVETRDFDMSFLDVIESTYPAITKIMRNPRKSIRYDEDLVNVEKAKKVNSATVRHLSSHTQLIKEITKEGDVIPSKVLTTFAEEELAIYENRFLKSLVKRIEMFLERRYEVMKISIESLETQKLSVANEFLMSGQQVNVNLDISITNKLDTEVKTTKEQYNRLLYVKEMIHGLYGTEFMRGMAKAKDVLPPIMKTNIILHNPDFRMCYELWVYLDKVDRLATNVCVKEDTFRYTSKFDSDINNIMALAVTSFIKHRDIEDIYVTKNLPQKKAPKVLENNEIELEMELEAENTKMEDYSLNQLLLEQTAEFYEAAFQGIREGKISFHESVKTVYKQMLEMLDQIYPKAFGVPDYKLESKDVYEELEFARRKLQVNKIVRAQKQANLLKMSKEQKDIEREIAEIERRVKIYEEEERKRLEELHQKEQKRILAQLERERKEAEKLQQAEQEEIQTVDVNLEENIVVESEIIPTPEEEVVALETVEVEEKVLEETNLGE